MPSIDTTQPTGRRLLTKKQVAELYQVSTRTIDNWVKRGMPFVPCGGAKRFDPVEVAAWLARDAHARLRAKEARGAA